MYLKSTSDRKTASIHFFKKNCKAQKIQKPEYPPFD